MQIGIVVVEEEEVMALMEADDHHMVVVAADAVVEWAVLGKIPLSIYKLLIGTMFNSDLLRRNSMSLIALLKKGIPSIKCLNMCSYNFVELFSFCFLFIRGSLIKIEYCNFVGLVYI